MFFSIGRNSKDNFSEHYQLGPFAVSTDAGWQQHGNQDRVLIYKGYADQDALPALLDQICTQTQPELLGNFCVIVFDRASQGLHIHTDRYRSFPIYIDQHSVNNLRPTDKTAWTDSLIKIDRDFAVTESKFDVIGTIDTTPISVSEAIDKIHQRLTQKTQAFVRHNTRPVRAFLSGGVDSLLVYSYLQACTQDYELVKSDVIEFDRFWLMNSGDIKRHWAYSQIHHWLTPCVLTSGAPGDEFMLRSPVTADLFLKYHGIKILDLLQQQTWLHSEYFDQDKHVKLFNTQTVDTAMSQEQFHRHLCNIVINDWQHWHLGHTLTWTPLRDLEIFKLLLRLPAPQAIPQIMDSYISQQLIAKNSPALTALISDQKNTGNVMKNLCSFLLESR